MATEMANHAERCRWCKEPIDPDAVKCPKCSTWQANPYGPNGLLLGSIVTAGLLPLALFVATMAYQHTERAQDATRTGLDHTFKEVKSIVDTLGEWQTNYDSLLMDCDPDHAKDSDKCLADYTRRLVKMDAFIAQLSWAAGSAPIGAYALSKINALKDAWWNTTRHAIDNTFGRLAVRTGTSAVDTDAATPDDDYNKLVKQCEDRWNDPRCPSLSQCQVHGFEHSECVKEIGDKLKALDAPSLSAFCGLAMSLNVARFKALRELNASDAALSDLKKQICSGVCFDSVRKEYSDVAEVCGRGE